jgi:probable F420-dependent oxidoreductase
MELGVILPNAGPLANRDALLRIAERAEALGFDALWTADHLAIPAAELRYPYALERGVSLSPDYPILEPLIALAAVAARTDRIRLGVSVYLAALRHPLVCAKLVASLDQLARGRVLLGVGAGWIRREYELLGVPWAQRGAVLDEHLACLRELFRADRPAFAGRFYALDGIGFEPKPAGRAVPIWIGGNGAAALRRAARLGDGWHPIDLSAAELERGLAELDEHLAEHGRDRAQLVISMRCSLRVGEPAAARAPRPYPLAGTLAEVIGELRALQRAGLQHAALWPPARGDDLADYLASLERIAREIRPALA